MTAAVEFASTWKNAYQMESAGISDNGDHQFVALNNDTWPLGNFFTRWKPNRFIVCTTVEPSFIQGYNVMTGSLLLYLKHPQ
jgi:glucose-6-phosphate isomerase